jgi:hypothetical protein
MEIQMNTLLKTTLGAALLAGSVLAISAPASAQPGYGGGYGDTYRGGGYGNGSRGGYGYDNGRGYDGGRYEFDDRYGDRFYRGGGMWRQTRLCTSPRFGRWRFDPVLARRIFVPYRWAVRGGYLRDCMYATNRYGGYRGGYR